MSTTPRPWKRGGPGFPHHIVAELAERRAELDRAIGPRPTPAPPRERIVFDRCGFNATRPRYTHYPTGETCLRQDWMCGSTWAEKRAAFFASHPGLPIEDEQGNVLKEIS